MVSVLFIVLSIVSIHEDIHNRESLVTCSLPNTLRVCARTRRVLLFIIDSAPDNFSWLLNRFTPPSTPDEERMCTSAPNVSNRFVRRSNARRAIEELPLSRSSPQWGLFVATAGTFWQWSQIALVSNKNLNSNLTKRNKNAIKQCGFVDCTESIWHESWIQNNSLCV